MTSAAQFNLPFPIRALNGAFAASGRLGCKAVSLEPASLMAAATRKTGLSDFGSDAMAENLARLCASLEGDASLSGLGRIMARADLLRLLGNRLQFEEIFKQYPEIAEQEIKDPIFILGMPRTGTTSLHELMAMDPQFRVPLSWETAHPFPPPETATYRNDPRIAATNKDLAYVDRMAPDFKHAHPMGAELPQECVALFAHDFASMIFDVQFRVKSYQDWVTRADMTHVFANHRKWLQLLQWKCPGDAWVLKSPQYLWNIDDMMREYPDARIVQMHRDPVEVAMSIGNLTATLRRLGSDNVDVKEVTQGYADLLHYGVGRTMEARAAGRLSPERVIDIPFKDFRSDTVDVVGRIYGFFGLEFGETARGTMTDFIEAGRKAKRHSQHQYTLASSGLDLAAERERFTGYQEAYDIPSEIS